MQNFTQDVNDIIKKHKTKRLYAITAFVLSLAVVFMVVSSLIRPAISATRLDNNSIKINDAKMLVGSSSELYSLSDGTVSDVIQKANDKYALGIASQFSVFLNGDFTPKDADTEGRIAIGGSLNPSGYIWGSSDGTGYNVGLGHYVSDGNSKSLSELGILTYDDYAHGIINGSYIGGKLAYKPIVNGSTLYRRFLISSNTNYSDNYGGQEWVFYKADSEPIIDFDSTFALLKQRSNTISANAKKSSDTSVTVLKNDSGKVYEVKFDGNANGKTSESIMFNVSQDIWNDIVNNADESGIKFNFVNIPSLSQTISGSQVDSSGNISTVNWQNSYIMINVESGSDVVIPYAPIHTFVNGTEIGKKEENNSLVIPNNQFGCSTLLYNFSNAQSLTLGMDFQGTILAPNANVTDNPIYGDSEHPQRCPGHLSGALIAQSFEGYTEFGYRPYTGPIEVLGTTTNYEISVAKVDGNRNPLSGATIQLYQISEGTETLYNEYVTDGTTKTLNVVPGKYKLVESAAPNGYNKSNDTYYFEVSEGDKQTANIQISQDVIKQETAHLEKIVWITSEYTFNGYSSLTISVTYSDGTSKIFNKNDLTMKQWSPEYQNWLQVENSELQNQDIQSISITGSGTTAEVLVCKNSNNDALLNGNVGDGNSLIWSGGQITVSGQSISVSYISSVTINEYADSSFSGTPKSTTTIYPYNTSDLSKVSYDIDGTRVSASDAASSYGKVSGDCTFIVKDGIPLTPIVNLSDFVFVNTAIPKGANITLQKADKDNTSTELSGAQVSLYASDGTKIGTYTLGTVTLSAYNSTDSYFDNNKLKPGSYYLVEESVPDGYLENVKGKQLKFTVGEDGAVAIPSDENSSWLKLENADSQYTIKIFNEQGRNIEIGKKWVNSSGESITPPDNAEITVKLYRTTDASIQNSTVNKASSARLFSVSRAASTTGDDSWFTIENILSNYQFFVSGDAAASTHVMGAVAVGGNASLASWGDSQISPTYVNNILSYSSFYTSNTVVGDKKNNDVYYSTLGTGVTAGATFEQKPGFINFEKAMNNVQLQSESISTDDANYTFKESDLEIVNRGWTTNTYLNIDVSKYPDKKFVIPYDVYEKIDIINFFDSTADFTVGNLARDGYTISITNVGNNSINLKYQNTEENQTDKATVRIQCTNKSIDYSTLEQDVQYSSSGTNLLFNFPDATNITVSDRQLGHIVAPKAAVYEAGNTEGGVIASSITLNNEVHFWPYYAVGTTTICPGSSTSGDDPSSQPDESSSSSSDDSSSTSSGTDSSSSSSADSSSGTESGGVEITGEFVKDITLNNDNDWKQMVSGLPIQDESGNKYYYYVEETPTIDGYTPTYSGPVTLTKGGTAKITITNTQNAYTLPATGGIGRYVFYIAGGMLACTSAAILVIQRRKKRLN